MISYGSDDMAEKGPIFTSISGRHVKEVGLDCILHHNKMTRETVWEQVAECLIRNKLRLRFGQV